MIEKRTILFDLDHLYRLGTLMFIYERGMKIGLGSVVANNDEGMFVDVDFTAEPKTGELSYGLVSDAIDKHE
jgi:hypothetical protein